MKALIESKKILKDENEEVKKQLGDKENQVDVARAENANLKKQLDIGWAMAWRVLTFIDKLQAGVRRPFY